MEQSTIFDPFPTLSTSRLTLRELTLDDAEAHFRIRADPEVVRHFGAAPDTSVDEAVRRIEVVREGVRTGASIRWAIADREGGAFLGSGGFWRWDKRHCRAELGYELASARWGQGLMTEAVAAMIRFGFEAMGLHSMEANVDPQNLASARVLLKLGFRQEALFRENYFFNGKFCDSAIFARLRESP